MLELTKTRKELEADITTKAWKDEAYLKKLKANPKGVLEEEIKNLGGTGKLGSDVVVELKEEDAKHIYLVIPRNPAEVSGQKLTDEQLRNAAGGILEPWKFKQHKDNPT